MDEVYFTRDEKQLFSFLNRSSSFFFLFFLLFYLFIYFKYRFRCFSAMKNKTKKKKAKKCIKLREKGRNQAVRGLFPMGGGESGTGEGRI